MDFCCSLTALISSERRSSDLLMSSISSFAGCFLGVTGCGWVIELTGYFGTMEMRCVINGSKHKPFPDTLCVQRTVAAECIWADTSKLVPVSWKYYRAQPLVYLIHSPHRITTLNQPESHAICDCAYRRAAPPAWCHLISVDESPSSGKFRSTLMAPSLKLSVAGIGRWL